MADEPTGQSVVLSPPAAPRPVKVYEPVADVVPILDTARFEHMQRIATIMAGSSLIPDSLRMGGSGNDKYELAPAMVVANCFLIVNQAVRWGMDPFAVAGSTSVVHGRLMYEGKLVAAVLESKLGLQLKYEFGKWNALTETVDLSEEGMNDLLGVRVSAQRAGDAEPVFIEGAVSIWKTAGNNSPWKPGAFKRQLRYRGAREWARAYNSGLMLGVITDDELDVLAERRETAQRLGRGAAPRLEGGEPAPRRALTAGFGDETDQILRKGTEEPVEPRDDAGASTEASEGGDAAQDAAEATGETIRLSREDQLASMFDLGRAAYEEEYTRDAPPDLDSEEAEHWLNGWDSKHEEYLLEEGAEAAKRSEPCIPPADLEEDEAEVWERGHTAEVERQAAEAPTETTAEPGEQYLMVGDAYNDKARRQTYRDGLPMSTVTEKGAKTLKEHHHHAPLKEEGTASAGEPSDQSPTESPPSSDASPPDEKTPERQVLDERQKARGSTPADDHFPGDPKPGDEAPPNPFVAAHEAIDKAETWLAIKGILRDISQTDAYRAAEDEGRRMLRLWAWDAYAELRNTGKETVEPSVDVTLFRFWMEFAAKEEAQITSLFRSLSRSPAYQGASDGDKRALGELIAKKKAELAGGQ